MANPFPKDQRDAIVARCNDLWSRMYPRDGSPPPPDGEFLRIREAYYQGLGEYADRLPRVPMGVNPFSGEPFLHSFDPYGFDGWWWHVDLVVELEEPRAGSEFQVLLGAVTLNRPAPTEVRGDVVRPGPDVPFVVPALLELPGMQAVIGRVEMETGDVAWPVSYWSDREIPPQMLHQPWCREMWWFPDPVSGKSAWSIANDLWDFDLAPWVERGQLSWVDLTADEPTPRREGLEFLYELPGQRRPQLLADGRRDFLEPPNGERVVPFGEPDDGEVPKLSPEDEAELEGDDPEVASWLEEDED